MHKEHKNVIKQSGSTHDFSLVFLQIHQGSAEKSFNSLQEELHANYNLFTTFFSHRVVLQLDCCLEMNLNGTAEENSRTQFAKVEQWIIVKNKATPELNLKP